MSADPRIAPSAARERRAFAAGLRPRARWLVPAGLCAMLLAAFAGSDARGLARGLGLHAAPDMQDPAAVLVGAARHLLAGTLGIAAVVLAVVATVGIVSGGLGAVSSAERRRLVIGPIVLRPAIALVGGVGMILGALALLRGIVAGAARAPASTEAGLAALFVGATTRVLFVVTGLLAVAGLAELLASRWANRRALFQTDAQARADARSDGGRRG